MNQIALVIHTFEQYPMLVMAFIIIVVSIGGIMYRMLLQPKLRRIEDIANANTDRIVDIKDDLNVKHFELKSDIKDLVHNQGEQMKTLVTTLMDGVGAQISNMNSHNEQQHAELFHKVDELGSCHHDLDKRLSRVENKRRV